MLSTIKTEKELIPLLEGLRLWFRQRKMERANRRNIENLALGAEGMRRIPMMWR